MLKTIKSKIAVLTGSVLLVLLVLMVVISFFNFKSNKDLIVNGNKFNMEHIIAQFDSEMSKLEESVLNLALLGEFYANTSQSDKTLNDLVIQNFKTYSTSLGGGIWFKPYRLNSNKRLKAFYAYRDAEGEVILDPSFESDQYDYPMQRWYLEILPRLSKKNTLVWSTPYIESQGSEALMTTVGAGIYQKGKLIGLATTDWEMTSLVKIISSFKPTPNSFALLADKDKDFVISVTDPYLKSRKTWGLSLSLIPWYHGDLENQSEFTYQGRVYIPYVKNLDNGMVLIINIPRDELFHSSIRYFYLTLSLLLITCILIATGLYFLLQKNINKPIALLAKSAEEIGQGNLDVKIQLKDPAELSHLATTLNKMTQDLKENLIHITNMSKAKEKIEAELSVAHNIQKDALPNDFPKNPNFELIASMNPARDVGGDFYDFFFIDDTHFAFVMADVSGKGITAALFMMSAKTMIKNILQSGCSLEQAAKKVNKGLYDNHSRGMFLTAFICVLDLRTGEVHYINAGHCPPLIRSESGYQYLEPLRNLMLGIMPTYEYQIGSFKLKPNERIFLYTDGVTEAQTKDEKLFGPARLEKALNKEGTSLPDTLTRVRKAIEKYVAGAEQSDDITMMELIYYGWNTKSKVFEANEKALPELAQFVQKNIKISSQKKEKLDPLIKDIFSQISKNAYTEKGTIRIKITTNKKVSEITFYDWGKAYNPLKKLSVHSGNITYQRIDGQNVLTITLKG